MGFSAYFLITWDVIRYAQSRGFFFVGRGSGANSIVAYCLQITDVDPIELDLYFERFLNPSRSHHLILIWIFPGKTGMKSSIIFLRNMGANMSACSDPILLFKPEPFLRELGKVFGLPKEEIDQSRFRKSEEDKIQRQIRYYGNLLRNFPNHLSIHAGGMLISDTSDLSVYRYRTSPKKFLYLADRYVRRRKNRFI